MKKDPNFHKKYTEKIDDYFEKGYIQRLTLEEPKNFTDRTYYFTSFLCYKPK